MSVYEKIEGTVTVYVGNSIKDAKKIKEFISNLSIDWNTYSNIMNTKLRSNYDKMIYNHIDVSIIEEPIEVGNINVTDYLLVIYYDNQILMNDIEDYMTLDAVYSYISMMLKKCETLHNIFYDIEEKNIKATPPEDLYAELNESYERI